MKKNKKQVIAYIHTHWDPEWYRSLEEFNVRLVEVMDRVLVDLKNNKMPSFYFDGQVLALLNYLKFRPNKKNLIKKLIKEKKLFIGPFFVSADSFLVSKYSLEKNLELGIKISKEFGENEFIGYLSDTFGHSKSIFEILKKFNIDHAICWRGIGDLPSDFTFNGIKTTRLVWGYYQDVLNLCLSLDKKAEIIESILDKINEKSKDILLLPLGADHMAHFNNPKDTICEINKRLKNYEIILSSPFEYIKRADYSKLKLEGEFLDNSKTYILRGVYSTRTDEKAVNSILEFELYKKAYPFNKKMGNKYENELNQAAIELLKNHAHDSIYGCSTDTVHQAVRARQKSVEETIKAVQNRLIRDFKKKYLKKETTEKIGVFNFSNYNQEGEIKVLVDKKIKEGELIQKFKSVSNDIYYDIYKNPMTEDFHWFYEYLIEVDLINKNSFKNVKIKAPVKNHIIGDDFIENKHLKLFVSENKIYVINKQNNELYKDFISIQSTKECGDSYNYAPIEYGKILKIKNSKIKKEGKIKSTLNILFEENISLNISLTNKSEFFEIEADFTNKKKNRKLQILINTNKKVKKTIVPYSEGTLERVHDENYLLFENMPSKDKEELKTNSYPMNSYVYTNGIGIMTKGLNEYEVYKNTIKITLLRSIGIISNPNNKARGVPAGPPIECTDMQGIGKHKFYLGVTFNKKEDIKRLADNFFGSMVGILGEFKSFNK